MQPDVSRPPNTGTVSPLAARLSRLAYVLGFVSLSHFLLFFVGVPELNIQGIVPDEQYGLAYYIVLISMVITSLLTMVIAIVALRQMREVSASVVQRVRAGRAMAMGLLTLSFPLGLFCVFIALATLSGGKL